MRSIVFLLTVLILLPITAEKKSEHLKSRIYFYKNVSEEELNGWEKDFFKDHFKDEPMSIPDIDPITDNEVHDVDMIVKSIKQKKKIKRNEVYQLRNMPIVKKGPVKKFKEEVPDEIKTAPEVEEIEKPDNEILSTKTPKKNITPDEISEIPDNEVDTGKGIRKMKKLLKKRKGKRRIDKRRVF